MTTMRKTFVLVICIIPFVAAICSSRWYPVGGYCYQLVGSSENSLDAFALTCAKLGSTLAVFPTLQDYTNFYIYWATLPGPPYSILGYSHLVGLPNISDIVSIYTDQQITYSNYFVHGNPDFWQNNEWCIHMKPQNGTHMNNMNDMKCEDKILAPMCQTLDTLGSNVSCTALCQSLTPNGHRFTTSFKNCQSEATVENATVGYTMTAFVPGLSEIIYEVKSLTDNNTLMVYGQQGLAAVSSTYAFVRSFIVSTVQASSSMVQFTLMMNAAGTDTFICQTNSSLYQTMLSQSYAPQLSFFMFTDMSDNMCTVCTAFTWSEWQVLTPCNTICGNGSEVRIRNKIGDCIGNETTIVTCNRTQCPNCGNGWTAAGSYCYQSASSPSASLAAYTLTCAKLNSILAVFPTEQDYINFYYYWSALPNPPYSILGYTHLVGQASFSDICSLYTDQPITFPNYFTTGNPDFWHSSEWCINMNPINGVKITDMNDVECEQVSGLNPMCQKIVSLGANVSCSPLCSSLTSSGHRYTTNTKSCQNESTIENETIAYTMSQFVDGVSVIIYEMKSSTTGNTLMVYDQQGLTSLDPSYTFQRSFIVATTQISSNMDQFIIMKNSSGMDTIICQTNSTTYDSLIFQNYAPQQLFYMFNQMSNYTCETEPLPTPHFNERSFGTTLSNGSATQVRQLYFFFILFVNAVILGYTLD